MANGDITKIVHLGRIALPGGGKTTSDGQIQNKVVVWGEITCTSVSTGIDLAGVNGNIKALGVDTLDVIDIRLVSTDGAAPADDLLYLFDLNRSTNLIHALEDVGAADAAAPSNGDALVLSYWAVGDEHVSELT